MSKIAEYHHMRGTLELIAGHEHRTVTWSGGAVQHLVLGDWNRSSDFGEASFDPDTCPVCMARKCLDQIDANEVPPMEVDA